MPPFPLPPNSTRAHQRVSRHHQRALLLRPAARSAHSNAFGRELDVVAVDSLKHGDGRAGAASRSGAGQLARRRRAIRRSTCRICEDAASSASAWRALGSASSIDHGQRHRAAASHVTRCDALYPTRRGSRQHVALLSAGESRRRISSPVLASVARARGALQVPDAASKTTSTRAPPASSSSALSAVNASCVTLTGSPRRVDRATSLSCAASAALVPALAAETSARAARASTPGCAPEPSKQFWRAPRGPSAKRQARTPCAAVPSAPAPLLLRVERPVRPPCRRDNSSTPASRASSRSWRCCCPRCDSATARRRGGARADPPLPA